MAHTNSRRKLFSPGSSQLVRRTEGLTLKGRRVWPGHQALLLLYLPLSKILMVGTGLGKRLGPLLLTQEELLRGGERQRELLAFATVQTAACP